MSREFTTCIRTKKAESCIRCNAAWMMEPRACKAQKRWEKSLQDLSRKLQGLKKSAKKTKQKRKSAAA